VATHSVDLVVIGTGSAASTVAAECRGAGWSVAIVDSRPFGGTCALRGCDPKKVLVGAAEVVDWVRRMKGRGVHGDGVSIDWGELMRFKRSFTDPVPQQREEGFARAAIRAFRGKARFVEPAAIQVGDATLQGRFVVIATGAKPADLGIPGQEYVLISDQFLELDRLPERIVFVGGGYVSFEFSHLAARAGSHVTILHRGPRPLEAFDPDLVGCLVEHTRKIGIRVELSTTVQAVEKGPKGWLVRTERAGESRILEADLVVHGAGRVADLDDLGLDVAIVRRGRRGVEVNDYLQSVSNPRVYAAGDAASVGPPLTPVAGHDGRVVAENLVHGNRRKAEYRVVPSVVFTIPVLATVGMQEESARRQGLKFRVHREDTGAWYSSRRVGEQCSAFKLMIEQGTERLLGAHLLGSQSEELINLFALAMRAGIGAGDLREALWAYPTHGSNVPYML
jgi:glutathione reductase (NADPH)